MVLDDPALIQKILDGGYAAFEQLVQKYEKETIRLVQSIVKDESMVGDVVQETFFQVYQKLKDFKGESSFKTWLYRITVNTSLEEMRKHRRWSWWKRERTEELAQEMDPPLSSAEEKLIDFEQSSLIRSLLDQLPEESRLILHLRYYENLETPEMAAILSVPEGTVRSRLFNARKRLEKLLTPHL
ncbi:MAG: sigma-70 family RNA polymerase sigma factor [Deltaproteobacteria bacterium]|nr:sigma-70 family RNA polymerase sigma factor [Deltaproteobacteria bacterium]